MARLPSSTTPNTCISIIFISHIPLSSLGRTAQPLRSIHQNRTVSLSQHSHWLSINQQHSSRIHQHNDATLPPETKHLSCTAIRHLSLATMVAIIESVVAVSVFVTITAIMAAHHAEERLKQRFTKNGNKYHRFDQKVFRFQERLRKQEPPSRHYCPHEHPLD